METSPKIKAALLSIALLTAPGLTAEAQACVSLSDEFNISIPGEGDVHMKKTEPTKKLESGKEVKILNAGMIEVKSQDGSVKKFKIYGIARTLDPKCGDVKAVEAQ
jgi:hypothetical protein